jgi:alpha-galactosidase
MLLQTVAQILDFKSFSDPINWLDKAELQDLNDFLKSECNVKQLKRHVFQVDEKIVDFTEIINPTKRVSDFILLK